MSGSSKRERLVLLTVVVLAAAALRLWNLDGAPPGISGDEIFNAIDAGKIGGGTWPVYFPGNNGRESLFFYLLALTLRLVGENGLALRLPAAFCGVLAVPVAYRLGADLRNWRTGALAAALLALSFWPLLHARWGLRAVTLTLFSGLTVWLYWRARRTGRLSLWLAAGATLGLTFYTYIPAQIFPLLIPIWLLLLFWQLPALRAAQGRAAIVSLVTAAMVMLPYLLYMLRFPERVNQRVGTLYTTFDAVAQGDGTTALRALAEGIGFLAWSGDATWRYNIAGRPAFALPLALLLAAGIVLAVWRMWRGPASRRADYALLLLWLGALYAPNLLVPGDVSALRPAGAVIPALLLIALAVERIASAARVARDARLSRLVWGAVAVALLLAGGQTIRDYFDVWATAPETRQIYSADLSLLDDYLSEHPPPSGTRIVAGYGYVRDITLAEGWRFVGGTDVSWFEREGALAWPAAEPAWIFIPADGAPPPAAVGRLLGNGTPVSYADGQVAWIRYQVPARPSWEPALVEPIEFSNGPRFLGYDVAREIVQGERLTVLLHWQIPDVQERPPNELTFVAVNLRDGWGNERSRSDALLAYPQSSWRSGDRFVQALSLAIPVGMLPGPAALDVQLFDADGRTYPHQRLAEPAEAHLLVRRQVAENVDVAPTDVVYGDVLALQDATLSTLVAPGLDSYIALEWLAVRDVGRDVQVRLSVTEPGSDEPLFSQVDALLPDIYPPSRWLRGERITTLHELAVPLDLDVDGELVLRVDVVESGQGQPLSVDQGSDAVATLTVDRREHYFEAPPPATALDVPIGEAFTLLGYDVDRRTVAPGEALELTLQWQARMRPDRNYTVFTHLVDDANQIWGQLDSPPVGEAWRTETWLPGEIVSERRQVPVKSDAPPGTYRLLVGLYDSDTVERLPVNGGTGAPADAVYLGEIQVTP